MRAGLEGRAQNQRLRDHDARTQSFPFSRREPPRRVATERSEIFAVFLTTCVVGRPLKVGQAPIIRLMDFMTETQSIGLSRVPEVTIGFWIIKILATTLGEVGGNAVTMQLGLGYLIGSAILAAVLIVLVAAQITAERF